MHFIPSLENISAGVVRPVPGQCTSYLVLYISLQVLLDRCPASDKELDTVRVMQAIQKARNKAKDIKTKKVLYKQCNP